MKRIHASFLASALTISACVPLEGTEWSLPASLDAGADVATNGCIHNIIKGSPTAWIQKQPQMHLIFWNDFPTNEAITYLDAWDDLLNNSTVLQRLSEYGIQGGYLDYQFYNAIPSNPILLHPTLGDAGISAGDAGTLYSDDGIEGELNLEIQTGAIPAPTDNTIYMVMFPPNTLTYDMYAGGWGGYHGAATYGGQRYTFGIISYHSNWQFTDEIISHELGEAATDPDTLTGWRDYPSGQEIADLCLYIPTTIDGYTVQKYWSEMACQCQ